MNLFYDMCSIELISEGASGQCTNEDAVGAGENFLFVIDGATGLTEENVMGQDSDARWFTQEIKTALIRGLPNEELLVSDILRDCIVNLAKQWKGSEVDSPSAGLAVWRKRGEVLEYFGLGDCDASLEQKNGGFIAWREENLTNLDAIALKEMMRLCQNSGCSMTEARQSCNDILLHNRLLKNTVNGYWCLDLTGKGIPNARRAEIPRRQVKSIFVCSDGFSQLLGFGAASSLEELHRLSLRRGLKSLYHDLCRYQEEDSDMFVVPRFKFRDDTSAGIARLGEKGILNAKV